MQSDMFGEDDDAEDDHASHYSGSVGSTAAALMDRHTRPTVLNVSLAKIQDAHLPIFFRTDCFSVAEDADDASLTSTTLSDMESAFAREYQTGSRPIASLASLAAPASNAHGGHSQMHAEDHASGSESGPSYSLISCPTSYFSLHCISSTAISSHLILRMMCISLEPERNALLVMQSDHNFSEARAHLLVQLSKFPLRMSSLTSQRSVFMERDVGKPESSLQHMAAADQQVACISAGSIVVSDCIVSLYRALFFPINVD